MNHAKFFTRPCVDTAAVKMRVSGVRAEVKVRIGRTVRLLEPLLPRLQVVHLVHDLFHNTLQLAHLRLERRERLLVRNSAVWRKPRSAGNRGDAGGYSLVVDSVGTNVNVKVNNSRLRLSVVRST